MTNPLDGIGMPTTTILGPVRTGFSSDRAFMTVTAGPSRSNTTIHLPVGVSLVSVDFDFAIGQAGLRMLRNGIVTFPLGHEDRRIESHLVRIVNDDPSAWIAVQYSHLDGYNETYAASRAAVTIYPALAV